jgi:ribosomal protein S18 acetylase RimI-like enzyme
MPLIQTPRGSCEWSVEDGYVHIYNLSVHQEFRRQGHGRFLLRKAISDIRYAGHAGDIYIVADPKDRFVDREKLVKFYESLGLKVYDYYG